MSSNEPLIPTTTSRQSAFGEEECSLPFMETLKMEEGSLGFNRKYSLEEDQQKSQPEALGRSSHDGFMCPSCHLVFIRPESCIVHMEQHNISTPLFMVHSEKTSQNMEIESPRGGEEKICSKKTFSFYECNLPDCGKKFRFLSQLERHLIHELQLRPFYCPHSGCSRTFKKKDTMENHYRLHTKERPFICELPYCRKTFPSKSGLRYHRTTHKNIRSFHCSFLDCDKTFPTKAQLKQHERATCIHYRYLSKAKMDDPLPSSDLENLVKSEFDFLKKENDP